ncbi:hypothetical protein L7F22_031214 [Adiantum nelumboides]|nr:hypothetical protein [Adiantum nelumboides]
MSLHDIVRSGKGSLDGRSNSYMKELCAASLGFLLDGAFPAIGGLSLIKSYAAMAHKTPVQSGLGSIAGQDQSRLPVNNLLPGNILHPPSFLLMHEYVSGDQGLKSMGMFNQKDDYLYENPPFDMGINGGNKANPYGGSHEGSPPNNAHLNDGVKGHSVLYKKDEASPSVVIPAKELENMHTQLQDRVVIGLCHGVRPSLESLRVWISQNWESKNIRITHVQYLPNGYYLFFCTDAHLALQIVSQGQWLIRSTPTSVFNWFIGFNPKDPKPTKANVWVDFIDFPIELYPWLKPIGNSLGRVLGQRSRGGINPKFDPQLLIEIDLSRELKYLIPIKDSCGRALHHQKVVYKTLPNAYFNCMKMGRFIKDLSELKPQQAVSDSEKKEDFKPIGKRNAIRNFKNNKASSSKNRNSFGPLLEDVFDPLENDTNAEVQENSSKEASSQMERQADPSSNAGKGKLDTKEQMASSPPNSLVVARSAYVSSSSDEDEFSIPNTQAIHVPNEEDLSIPTAGKRQYH